jgi:hypothetical protein
MLICSTICLSQSALTHLAIVQSRRAWRQVSSAAPHMSQHGLCAIFFLCLVYTVGNDCLTNRHKKTSSFDGTCTFQIDVHCFFFFSELECATTPSSQSSLLFLVSTNIL